MKSPATFTLGWLAGLLIAAAGLNCTADPLRPGNPAPPPEAMEPVASMRSVVEGLFDQRPTGPPGRMREAARAGVFTSPDLDPRGGRVQPVPMPLITLPEGDRPPGNGRPQPAAGVRSTQPSTSGGSVGDNAPGGSTSGAAAGSASRSRTADGNQPAIDNTPRTIPGPPVDFAMTYLERLPAPPRQLYDASGGLVGRVNDIARMMAGAGADADAIAAAAARSSMTLQPIVEVLPSGEWVVRLEVADARAEYDPALPAGSRANLEQEHDFLIEELKQWRFELTDQLKRDFIARGWLALPVSRPLAPIKKWTKGALSIKVLAEEADAVVVGVRFFAVGRSGVFPTSQLTDGMPAFAEIIFDREPPDDVTTLQLNGGSGVRALQAYKLEDQPTVFRTGQFVPWHSDGGLDVPPPSRRGSELPLADPAVSPSSIRPRGEDQR